MYFNKEKKIIILFRIKEENKLLKKEIKKIKEKNNILQERIRKICNENLKDKSSMKSNSILVNKKNNNHIFDDNSISEIKISNINSSINSNLNSSLNSNRKNLRRKIYFSESNTMSNNISNVITPEKSKRIIKDNNDKND